MNWRLKLALRNLLRSPRRSVLTTVAVVAGIGVFILGEGFIAGVEENIILSAIQGTTGHVMARPADYPTQVLQNPVDHLLTVDGARPLLDEETEAWTERLQFNARASTGRDAVRMRGIGYDPERDPTVFPRDLWKIQGAEPAPGADEILVSRGLARVLEVGPGDRLVLQTRTERGALNALETRVAGVVSTGNAALDTMTVLVPMPLARRLVNTERTSHVAVRLARREDASAFKARLAEALGEQAEVVTWEDETADLLRLQQVRRKALNFIVFILLALAGFGMANTILMAAYERTREVGTLRALGMTRRGVVGLFLAEGALMGLVGSLLGALWGGWLVGYWARNPIDMTEMVEEVQGGSFSVSALIYTHFSWTVVAGAVLFGVVVAVLASIYPARVASRMVPADAVRAE